MIVRLEKFYRIINLCYLMDEGKLPLLELKKILEFKGHKNQGIIEDGRVGSDVAIVDMNKAKISALSYYETDSDVYIVEKSDPITFPTSEPGKYAVIINANDISCSGAIPFGFLPTIVAPVNTSFEEILKIQQQTHKQCQKMNISILGGHTEVSKSVNSIIISGHMIGFVPINFLIPNKLYEGDKIIIVGYAGIEGTGILISEAKNELKENLSRAEVDEGIRIGSQLNVVDLALEINKKFQPSLIHDATEGGIYGALSELIAFSNMGINLEKDPPISPITLKLSKWLYFNPFRLISSGTLVISAPNQKAELIFDYLLKLDIPCSIIGRVTCEGGVLRKNNKVLDGPKGDELTTALSNLSKIRNE